MVTIVMNKSVTVMNELANNKTEVFECNYSKLADILHSISEVVVKYPFGALENSKKKLAKLGFNFKEQIYFDDSAPYTMIKEVWSR